MPSAPGDENGEVVERALCSSWRVSGLLMSRVPLGGEWGMGGTEEAERVGGGRLTRR